MMRKILLVFTLLYLGFVIYANTRHINPSAKIPMVDVKTFEVSQADSVELAAVRIVALENKSIRAVSINPKENLIGVTYELESIGAEDVARILSLDGTYQVGIKSISQNGPSCPVHGIMEVWDKALALHRIVD